MARVMVPRDSGAAGRVVPILSTLLFVVISVVPLQLPVFAAAMPSFALMAVAHWTIYRPELLPQWSVFVLGLLLDLLQGTPFLGISALVLLLARTAVMMARRHFVERDFTVMWLGFLALATGAFAFDWAFIGLSNGHLIPARPFLFEAALTVACFPIGSYVLAALQRAFLRG
jgi:rod shape-determining protein MreD